MMALFTVQPGVPDHPALAALSTYLTAWHAHDWPTMAEQTQLTWRAHQRDPADWLAAVHDPKRLVSATVISVTEFSRAMVDCDYRLVYRLRGQRIARTVTARIIRETAPYQPVTTIAITGAWGVNPLSTLAESA